MKDPNVYLKHILDAINQIGRYVSGLEKAAFLEDPKTQDAVVRQFEIIGEAVMHLDETVKEKHSSLPWQRIVDMRNKLIHEYFGVDMELVWETIVEELPTLKSSVNDILPSSGRHS